MDTVPVQNYFPKLSTQVASNDPSLECFTGITNLLYAFAATGKIVPFDEVWTPEQIADIEKDVPKRYLDTWRFKGKLYAIPNDSNAQWSFYRKDLFDKAGVKLPAKWEDAAAIAKQLTKDGVYGYTASLRRGEYAGAHFSSILFSYGGDYWDEGFNPTINSEAGKKAIADHAGADGLRRSRLDQCRRRRHGPSDRQRSGRLGAAGMGPLRPHRREKDPDCGQHRDGGAARRWRPSGRTLSWRPGLYDFQLDGQEGGRRQMVSYATSSKVMHTFVENQGQPARTSALTDPENVKIGRYFPTLQKVLAQGHPFPAIPETISSWSRSAIMWPKS